ncbi:efflux RND transporter periplasmic adaptor subunit [Acidiphilium sp.]|uniref:efflux RND transporter periplasmic adaptor subunit n=1 Tax=Acidiphilium sp. TaxID=527 RepID=UPI00258454BD|nr:efflux RND transporter periplasmic adaptor subunit [Acidiphilium sp.]
MAEESTGVVQREIAAPVKAGSTRSRRRMILPIIGLAVLLAGGGAVYWRVAHPPAVATTVAVYGTIDIRQVSLSFNDSDRIAQLLVQEGDRVQRGQLLATLDRTRLKANADKAAADGEAAQKTLTRLLDGSRPEEIAEARAALAAAVATEANARINFARYSKLSPTGAETRQNRDNAEQAMKVAIANRQAAEQALALAVEGPRWEDIAVARAQLASAQAAQAYADQQLKDAELHAPADGFIEDRILEPGDMVTPQTPVFTLDLTEPVYARAYLPERQLGAVRPGMRAVIETDAYPGEKFPAWVGFIATTAEFTPKTVETTEIRTELVYRMHVYACNPDGRLRLGAPVSVEIPLADNPPVARGEKPCG